MLLLRSERAIKALWRAMADEGRITEDEFARTTFYNYYRTVDEMCAPLVNVDSAVHAVGWITHRE